MKLIDIKDLLKKKVHLGHKFKISDPRIIKYIYKFYKSSCIINLIETRKSLIKVYNFLYKTSKKGNEIIYIGSKSNVKFILKEAALISANFYIINKWVPGTFTNENLIKNRICLIIWFEKIFFKLKKKSIISIKLLFKLKKLYEKTTKNFKGLKGLLYLPKTIFIVDPKNEKIAFKESIILKRNIISILDTNINPENITLPIPGNDDNKSSLKLIIQILTTALIQGSLIRKFFI